MFACVCAEIRESQCWPKRSTYLEGSNEKAVHLLYYFHLDSCENLPIVTLRFSGCSFKQQTIFFMVWVFVWWALCCVSNGGRRVIKSITRKHIYIFYIKSKIRKCIFIVWAKCFLWGKDSQCTHTYMYKLSQKKIKIDIPELIIVIILPSIFQRLCLVKSKQKIYVFGRNNLWKNGRARKGYDITYLVMIPVIAIL